MCGRTVSDLTEPEIQDLFARGHIDLEERSYLLHPFRYNVTPSQTVLVARATAGNAVELVPMRWGLVPHWTKDRKRSLFNARGETVRKLASFRAAFKTRRAVVPLTGFFEWETLADKGRQPWYFYPAHGRGWLFAAVWEPANEASGNVDTFTLVTTGPNELLAPLHDRSPVILLGDAARRWVFGTPDDAAALIAPLPGVAMVAHRVSSRVNHPSAQGTELIKALN